MPNETSTRNPYVLSNTKGLRLPGEKSPSKTLMSNGKNIPLSESLIYNGPAAEGTLEMAPYTIHTATDPRRMNFELLTQYPPKNCWPMTALLLGRWGLSPEEKEKRRKEFAEKKENGEQYMIPCFEGVAGTGKTTTPRFLYKLIYGKEMRVYDAGNKPLHHIMFVPKIGKNQKNILERLEAAFKAGKLAPSSVAQLRAETPAAFISTDGQETLNLSSPETFPLTENNRQLLNEIAKIENVLDASNSIGVEYEEGELIKAMREGTALLIDEADKALEGTSDELSRVFQVISGQLEGMTYTGPNGEKIEISRATLHPDFDIVLTANDLNNNPTQPNNPFSKHLLNRIKTHNVPPNGPEEIETRILQRLLGFNPIAAQLTCKNPQDIPKLVEAIYTAAGHSLSEKAARLLKKGNKLFQGARQVACANYALHMSLQDKIKSGSDDTINAKTANTNMDLTVRWSQANITEAKTYTHRPDIDPQTSPREYLPSDLDVDELIRALDESLTMTTPEKDYSIEIGTGESLKIIYQNWLQAFACEPSTRHEFNEILKSCRIFTSESEENNLNHGGIQPIEVLWNDLEEEISIDMSTYELQKSYVKILQKRFPELQTIEAEKIIPIQSLQKALDKAKELSSKDGPIAYIVGLSQNYMREKSGSPLALIPILDQKQNIDEIREQMSEAKTKTIAPILCGIDELEASLQNPTIRKTYIQTLWKPCKEKTLAEIEKNAGAGGPFDFLAMMVANPEIQAARIVCSKPDPKNPQEALKTPITVIQSQQKGVFLAYSPDFEETKTTGKTCITNDPKLAAEALLSGFPGPEGKINAIACSYWMQRHSEDIDINNQNNPALSYLDEKRIDSLTNEEALGEIEKHLKKSCEIDFNITPIPAKIMIRKEIKGNEQIGSLA